jgi:hypothetical protein
MVYDAKTIFQSNVSVATKVKNGHMTHGREPSIQETD